MSLYTLHNFTACKTKMAAKGIHNVRWPMRMAAQLRISLLQFPIGCRKPAQGYPYPQSKHCKQIRWTDIIVNYHTVLFQFVLNDW